LIHSGDINFYTTNSISKIPKVSNEASTHKIEVENTLTKKTRFLHFYPLTIPKTEASKQQAILKRGFKFKPKYQSTLDANWLAELNGEFLSRWVNGLGKSIKRKEYAVIGLAFGKKGITFKFCQRANTYVESKLIQFTNTNDSIAITVDVLAKDIIPTLNSLVYCDIVGNAVVEVDENAILIKYKTKSADYIIAIPTTNSKGIRNDDYFEAYGA
jgi:hypothetical protein